MFCLSTLDINNVSDLVELEVGGQMLHTSFLVASGEHVSGATTISLGVGHLGDGLTSESIIDAVENWQL